MKTLNKKDREFINNMFFKSHSPFYLSALKLKLDGKVFHEHPDLWIDTAIKIRDAVIVKKKSSSNKDRFSKKRQIRKLYTKLLNREIRNGR